VVSYAVRHRTVEIGTRMALGAVGRDVLRLVLGDGLRMAAYGIVIGGVVVVAAVFLLKSEVFGIRIDGPLPFLFFDRNCSGHRRAGLLLSRLARDPGCPHGLPSATIRDRSGAAHAAWRSEYRV